MATSVSRTPRRSLHALDTNNIPYKLDGGTIIVPADRVHDARLKLAAQGLPEGDGGFAVMSKEPGFGVSQFMEGARYQHALETELARTISNLQPVEGARVHLALPRQSAFVRDRRPPSASVFLQMKPGRRLEAEQVHGDRQPRRVEHPGAGSRSGHGRRSAGSPAVGAGRRRRNRRYARSNSNIARRMEERYTSRIEQLLAPLVGPGRVRAQVVADVELSTTEEAREQYKSGKPDRSQRADGGREQPQRRRSAGRARCAHQSAADAWRRVAARRCSRRAGGQR